MRAMDGDPVEAEIGGRAGAMRFRQENFALGLDPALRQSERPALLNRLGFVTWAGLGRVEAPRPATPLFVSPGIVGPLAADGTPSLQDPA